MQLEYFLHGVATINLSHHAFLFNRVAQVVCDATAFLLLSQPQVTSLGVLRVSLSVILHREDMVAVHQRLLSLDVVLIDGR